MVNEDRRIRITLAWDGTDYHGWQVQPGLPTIQGTLEEIVGELEGRPVHVEASGRTDAGVHARGQAVGTLVPERWTTERLRHALNSLLPKDVWVASGHEMRADFHAFPPFEGRVTHYAMATRLVAPHAPPR